MLPASCVEDCSVVVLKGEIPISEKWYGWLFFFLSYFLSTVMLRFFLLLGNPSRPISFPLRINFISIPSLSTPFLFNLNEICFVSPTNLLHMLLHVQVQFPTFLSIIRWCLSLLLILLPFYSFLCLFFFSFNLYKILIEFLYLFFYR